MPLAVSVVTGEAIQDGHINNLVDFTRAVPNLSYSTQAGAGLGTLEIRGISSQAGSATVSIYLDDVSLTKRNLYSQGISEPRFFDIDRVEVLRGPQGTLYGPSSLGGTIKFISNQPDPRAFSGHAHTERWIAGAYLADTKTQVFDNEPVFGINAAFTAARADTNDPAQLAGSFNHTILQQPSIQSVSEAYYIRPRTIRLSAQYSF